MSEPELRAGSPLQRRAQSPALLGVGVGGAAAGGGAGGDGAPSAFSHPRGSTPPPTALQPVPLAGRRASTSPFRMTPTMPLPYRAGTPPDMIPMPAMRASTPPNVAALRTPTPTRPRSTDPIPRAVSPSVSPYRPMRTPPRFTSPPRLRGTPASPARFPPPKAMRGAHPPGTFRPRAQSPHDASLVQRAKQANKQAMALLSHASRHAQALALLEKAVRLFGQAKHVQGEALMHGNLGSLHLLMGTLDKAVEHHTWHLQLSTSVGDVEGVTKARANLCTAFGRIAEAAFSRGAWDDAIANLNHRMQLAVVMGNPALQASAALQLARIALARGVAGTAQAKLNEAVALYERAMVMYVQQLQAQRAQQAQQAQQQQGHTTHHAQPAPRPSPALVRGLGASLELHMVAAAREGQWERVALLAGRCRVVFHNTYTFPKRVLDEITAAARMAYATARECALLEYWVVQEPSTDVHGVPCSEEAVYIMACCPTHGTPLRTTRAAVGDIDVDAVAREVGLAHAPSWHTVRDMVSALHQVAHQVQAGAGGNSTLALRALYKLLIEPVEDMLPAGPPVGDAPAHSVVVLTHSAIEGVPFGALLDRALQPCVKKFTLSRALVLKATGGVDERRKRKTRRSKEGNRTALVVGDPSPPGMFEKCSFGGMPWSAKEVEWIAQSMGVYPLVGEEATKTSVGRELSQAPHIHFACRAVSGKGMASHGALVLADMGTGEAAVLTSFDVESVRADVVVLNVRRCNDAPISAAQILRLGHLFIKAGAASVVFSLWGREDAPVQVLWAAKLYRLMSGDSVLSLPQMLRRVQLEMINGVCNNTEEQRLLDVCARDGIAVQSFASWAPYVVLGA